MKSWLSGWYHGFFFRMVSSIAGSYKSNRGFISSPAAANGNVYAFDVTTGTKLWSYKIGTAVYSSVAISDGVLYVTGSDGCFYVFSPGGV